MNQQFQLALESIGDIHFSIRAHATNFFSCSSSMHVFLWVILEISPLVCRGALCVYVIGTETVTVFLAMNVSLGLFLHCFSEHDHK